MKTFKTLIVLVSLSFVFLGANAQVENILKQTFPEMYGDLMITPGKKYDKSMKQEYRNLYFKLEDAKGDVKAFKLGAATPETMQVLDYKKVKELSKQKKLDSLIYLIKKHQKQINDFLKWDERFAADTVDIATYYTSYKDNFTAKKYDKAYKYWSILFHNYPLISHSIYSGGAFLLKYKIKKAKDSATRAAYIDTLWQLYDQEVKVYPKKKAYVAGKKTIDYYNIYVNKKDLNDSLVRLKMWDTYTMAMNAIKLGGVNTRFYVFPLAMKMTLLENELHKVTDEQAIDNYMKFSDILNTQYHLEKNPKLKTRIKSYGIDLIDKMFSKRFQSCDQLCPAFKQKYDQDSTNVDNLKKILTILGQKGCTDCQLYSNVAVKLNELEPTASSSYGLALLFASKENYTQALKYIDEAIKREVNDSLKADYYFKGAQIYNKMKDFVKARDYARKAIDLNPHLGNAYILIATMYATTAGSIGKDQFAHNAVFWAAVDKLYQAKKADPKVAPDADKLISTYSSHFPKKEEGFMHSVLEGSTYTVGGWINEVTKARYLK